jgi:hypothetical protein
MRLDGLLFLLLAAAAPQGAPPLERYRKAESPPTPENFDRGWKERTALEFEIVNSASLEALREGLKDPEPFVRSMSARVLGIRGDRASAGSLAGIAAKDPVAWVRVRAVESLGFLKSEREVLERARKDPDLAVAWTARMAAEQLDQETDFAAQVRKAFEPGIKPEEIGAAQVGRPAPGFTLATSEGAEFRLADVLGKKPVAIYFSAYDG